MTIYTEFQPAPIPQIYPVDTATRVGASVPASNPLTGSPAAARPNPYHAPTPSNSADEATLSSLGTLVAHALSASDLRLGKVAALRESIANRTYNVSASDVAGSLLNSLLG